MERCRVTERPITAGINPTSIVTDTSADTVTVIGIGQLRSDTCHYIGRAAAGETFDLLWRRRAVARLSAFDEAHDRCAAAVPLNVLRTRPSTLVGRVVAGETLTVEHLGDVAALRPLAHVASDRPRRLDPEFGPVSIRVGT